MLHQTSTSVPSGPPQLRLMHHPKGEPLSLTYYPVLLPSITFNPLFLPDSLEKLHDPYDITLPLFDLITLTSFITYAHSIMVIKTHKPSMLTLAVSAYFPSQ